MEVKVQGRENLILWLNYLENKYPVSEWKVDNIFVWPLIRLRVSNAVIMKGMSENKVKSYDKNNDTFKKKVLRIIDSLREWINIFRVIKTEKFDFIGSGYLAHRMLIRQNHYNRFYGPIVELYSCKKSKFLFLEQDNNEVNLNSHNGKVVHIKNALYIIQLLDKLRSNRDATLVLSDFENFEKEVKENLEGIGVKNNLSLSWLLKDIKDIKSYSNLYRIIFKRVRPRSVFSLCYYTLPHMALNNAAFSLNIPSIDLQHGLEGTLHVSYSSWRSLPSKGYSLLPKIFWNWDKESADVIEEWSANHLHKVFVGGNPWITAWKKKHWIEENFSEMRKTMSPQPIVLYTMQPIENAIPDFLIELIKATITCCKWVVKLHPRQLNQLQSFEELLNKIGLKDISDDLKSIIEIPLPLLLSNTVLHITNWSASCIEAKEMNVDTFFIHPYGKMYFKEQLSEMYYLGDNIKDAEEAKRLILLKIQEEKSAKLEADEEDEKVVWDKFNKFLDSEVFF